MKLRTSSWHFQLFHWAYIDDRGWLDGWDYSPRYDQSPEADAYSNFLDRKREDGSYVISDPTEEEQAEQSRLYQAAHVAYSTRRAEELRQRLYRNQMSLCPYFWNIVRAVIVYFVMVCTWRRIKNPAENIMTTAMIVAPILGVVWLLVQIPDFVATIVAERELKAAQQRISENESRLSAYYWKLEEERTRPERERRQAEEERLQKERELQWARERAEREALRQAEEAECLRTPECVAARTRAAAEDARRRIEPSSVWWEFAKALGTLMFIIIVFSAGLAGGAGLLMGFLWLLVWLLVKAFDLSLLLFTYFVFVKPEESERGRKFLAWLERVFERIASIVHTIKMFFRDTKELTVAFLKARKEQVCPFLQIENGH